MLHYLSMSSTHRYIVLVDKLNKKSAAEFLCCEISWKRIPNCLVPVDFIYN